MELGKNFQNLRIKNSTSAVKFMNIKNSASYFEIMDSQHLCIKRISMSNSSQQFSIMFWNHGLSTFVLRNY